jgi:diguanylate cyclase (GGDEF)-like protein
MQVTAHHTQVGNAGRRLPPAWAAAGAGVGLLLTFWLDRGTGSAPVQHLYYVPIVVAATAFGYRGGVLVAVLAIALYHVANPVLRTFRYAHTDIVQILLFLAVAIVTAKLSHDAARLHQLAMTDDLTGLHNLRSFERHLGAFVEQAVRSRAPLSVLMLDLDRLKALNDAHGHLKGAAAVRTVGALIAAHVPGNAVACRYGGDEFVVAIPCCDRLRAERLAEDLRTAVRSAAPVLDGLAFPAGTLSVSLGVASASWRLAREDVDLSRHLFAEADAALYAAKAGGRNQVRLVRSAAG